jgi:hypothetical protein
VIFGTLVVIWGTLVVIWGTLVVIFGTLVSPVQTLTANWTSSRHFPPPDLQSSDRSSNRISDPISLLLPFFDPKLET